MDKNSFVLMKDRLDEVMYLTDEQAGRLFKSIYLFENEEEPLELDQLTTLLFMGFKRQLEANDAKWDEVRRRRSENGRKGGRGNKANKANAFSEKQTKANKANTDTKTMTMTDTKTVSTKVDADQNRVRYMSAPAATCMSGQNRGAYRVLDTALIAGQRWISNRQRMNHCRGTMRRRDGSGGIRTAWSARKKSIFGSRRSGTSWAG